jgi:hypothetical protein
VAEFVNHHSFILAALAVWGALAALLLRDGVTRRDVLALAVAAGAFGAAWLGLRPGPGTFAAPAEVEAALGRGRPVLVEIYSNY